MTMEDAEDDEQGAFRWSDPETSKKAARAIKVGPIMRRILKYLSALQQPRNGWEMAKALDLPTITVVPRLAPMRRSGLIKLMDETRPGPPPKFCGQQAYEITDLGRQVIEPPEDRNGPRAVVP
jgi:hypothetical protein